MNSVDITPSPRVLRVLGDIPFQLWQCMAELIDNSIDAYLRLKDDDRPEECVINVNWSNDRVARSEWTVEVSDHATGMSLKQMTDAVRAGYSSNDPFNNLGLFGMGFNIATARLGECTEIYSGVIGEQAWNKITIDFAELQKNGEFEAPVEQVSKKPDDHGTRIVIRQIKPDYYEDFSKRSTSIYKSLGDIYAPLLEAKTVAIKVNGKSIQPRRHCVWNGSRSVSYKQHKVHAQKTIDIKLNDGFFDRKLNRHITGEEYEILKGIVDAQELEARVEIRPRRVTGWLGVQRYGDRTHFGIDFVRNGRKILLRDKTVFNKVSTFSGETTIEYPSDLPGTFGGRIIGVIHVDFLKPTYQKNDFDRSDNAWNDLISALRGNGDLVTQRRGEMNTCALAMLVNGYRRPDQGIKYLVAPNSQARDWAARFESGDPEYQDDSKWYEAALRVERENSEAGASSSPPDKGSAGVDNPSDYVGAPGEESGPIPAAPNPVDLPATPQSILQDLFSRSTQDLLLSGKYAYSRNAAPVQVDVFRLNLGAIHVNRLRRPCYMNRGGHRNEFVYDPAHPIFREFMLPPAMVMAVYLSQMFYARDNVEDIVEVFQGLLDEHLKDQRISAEELREKANSVFQDIRSFSSTELRDQAMKIYELIDEVPGARAEILEKVAGDPDLVNLINKREPAGLDALKYAPVELLIQLVFKLPENFLDGGLFNWSYTALRLGDDQQTEVLRQASLQRFVGMLRSAKWVISDYQTSEDQHLHEVKHANASLEIIITRLKR